MRKQRVQHTRRAGHAPIIDPRAWPIAVRSKYPIVLPDTVMAATLPSLVAMSARTPVVDA